MIGSLVLDLCCAIDVEHLLGGGGFECSFVSCPDDPHGSKWHGLMLLKFTDSAASKIQMSNFVLVK